jgi:hypothetical protein
VFGVEKEIGGKESRDEAEDGKWIRSARKK